MRQPSEEIYQHKIIYFNKEESVVLERFKRLIKFDNIIKNSIPENRKKIVTEDKMLSYAIRFLINAYVEKHTRKITNVTPTTTSEINNHEEVHIG